MFQHVHNSRYLDYIQAGRYEQMERCYNMTLEEFMIMGYGWVVKKATLNVSTQVQDINGSDASIDFEIINKKNNKISCDGQTFNYP